MRRILNTIYTVICVLLILVEFIGVLVGNESVILIKSFFGVFLLISSFFLSKIRDSLMPIVLLSAALILMVISGMDVQLMEMFVGFQEMHPIIVIVLVIPLISIVLKQKPYIESVMVFGIKWIKSSVHFHFLLLVFTQCISFFLLPTTVPVVYQFVSKLFGNESQWEVIQTTAIYRSVALAGVWVISFPSFAYAVEVLEVPLVTAIFQGVLLSALGVLLSVLFVIKLVKRSGMSFKIEEFTEVVVKRQQDLLNVKENAIEFLFLFSSLLMSILLFNFLLPLSLLTVIPLVTIIWTGIYFVVKKEKKPLLSDMKQFVKTGLIQKQKEINIFITAGFLVTALETSGIGEFLIKELYMLSTEHILFNLLLFFPLIITFFGMIGIPPSASMIMVVEFVNKLPYDYSNSTVLLSLTLGTAISVLISPIAVPGVLLSSINGQRPWQNSIQKNLYYAIVFFCISEIYIFCLNIFS